MSVSVYVQLSVVCDARVAMRELPISRFYNGLFTKDNATKQQAGFLWFQPLLDSDAKVCLLVAV